MEREDRSSCCHEGKEAWETEWPHFHWNCFVCLWGKAVVASWLGVKLCGFVTWESRRAVLLSHCVTLSSHFTLLWDGQNISLPAECPATIPVHRKGVRGAKASKLEITVFIYLGKQIYHLYSPSSLSKKYKVKKTQLPRSLSQLSSDIRQEVFVWCEPLIRPRRFTSHHAAGSSLQSPCFQQPTHLPGGCSKVRKSIRSIHQQLHTHPVDTGSLPTSHHRAAPI